MKRHIIAGRSNPQLGNRIAAALGETLTEHAIETLPDGEVYLRISEDLNGSDVFVIQGTAPPVAENLIELMLLGDACLRAGAARLTAVVPYFGYARQDRRTKNGEAVGARLVADMIASRYQRILAVDLHNPAIEGFFTISINHLTAVPMLAEALRSIVPGKAVVVAPDQGAVHLARQYADLLDLPVAYVHKVRVSGDEVEARHLTGSVRDLTPVIVDDMISTGGTIAAAIKVVLENGATARMCVAATHALFTGNVDERLATYPIEHIFVSDSVPSPTLRTLSIKTVSLGESIAIRIEAVCKGQID